MTVTLNPVQSSMDPDQTFLGIKIGQLEDAIDAGVFKEVVRIVAERYVEAHFVEIVAKLDQNAIANLAVAEAAKKIAEEIRSRPQIVQVDSKGNARLREL